MISPTNVPFRVDRPDLAASRPRHATRPAAASADGVSAERATFLRAQLAQLPEVRPEVVERACALAADPNYPSVDIARHIAAQILGAPDLSEIE